VKKIAIIFLSLFLAIIIFNGIIYGNNEYRLGVGDLLSISIFGYPEMTMEARVGPDGTVIVAFDDPITVDGFTLNEAKEAIKKIYSEYIKNPILSVTIKEYRTGKVKVLGALAKPAIYDFPIINMPTVGEIIAMAGGFSDKANSKMVYIIKEEEDGSAIVALNFNQLLDDGKMMDYPLGDGDTVYVPEREGGVLVLGEVLRPGQYSLKNDMKILDAIAQAGGVNRDAKLEEVTLTRTIGGEKKVIEVSLDKVLAADGGEGNILLEDGDILYVPLNTRLTVTDAVTILSAIKLIKDLVTGF
jgi:polysaccharide export outer membrane protein